MYKRNLIILVFPLLLVMCMTIENITHPDNPQINSEIEIGVDINLEPANDDNTKMIFAVLAPKKWDISNNAQVSFSTLGFSKGDVVDEQMTLVGETENEPTTNQLWSAAIENKNGMMGNLSGVEWVVFESQTIFNIAANDEESISAHIKVKLNTGSENIKVSMGYFFCGKSKGLNTSYYRENAKSKILRITGGTNDIIDYTSDTEPTTGALDEYSVFTIQNVSSGYNMGIAGDILYNEKFKDKAQIEQEETVLDFESLPEKWQRWYFIYKGKDGGINYYQIMNAMSGKFLDVPEGASTNGLQLQQFTEKEGTFLDEQLWGVTEVTTGKYKIINKSTNLALTAESIEQNVGISQSLYDQSDLQLWALFKNNLCSYRDDKVVHFFERNDKSSGSTAFDQGSSIPLPDGRVLWVTQDSWDGWELTEDNMFYSNYYFNYGNSMFLQPTKDNWNPDEALNITRENSAQNKPRQICDIQPNQTFAWPSNGVEINGKVYLHCGEGSGLSAEGQTIYELWPKSEGSLLWNSVRHAIPEISTYTKIIYSAGMVKSDDGYVYTYGAAVNITNYNLYVARFEQDDPLNTWTFWDGSNWIDNPPANDAELEAARIFSGTGASVAVSYVNGKYVVVSLDQGFWETSEHYIRSATSDSPTGSFTKQKKIYNIFENIYGTQARYYTPNIHPQFDNGKDELLITYSLNYSANDSQDITVNQFGEKVIDGNILTGQGYIDPYFYRVKGVRVPYSVIGINSDSTTGTNEENLVSKTIVELFPNPVSDVLNVKSSFIHCGDTYQIFNMGGVQVDSGKIENGAINLSALNKGVYVFKLVSDHIGYETKFIKK